MRSLRSAKDAKIFKFHDFTEDEPESSKDDYDFPIPHIPYVSFGDEDAPDEDVPVRQGKRGIAAVPYLTFGDEDFRFRASDERINTKKEPDVLAEQTAAREGPPVITEVPYLTFEDEDFYFKKG